MQEQIRRLAASKPATWMRARLAETSSSRRNMTRAVVVAAVVGIALLSGVWAVATLASEENVLANGSFEHGFSPIDGCGMVGNQWSCFTNGGAANYGFYDDQWDLTVSEGDHSQLIEINTKGMAAADADRYAGIYQTVRVVPGAKYDFGLRGMIRTTDMTGDPWRYRVQVGWAAGPNVPWQQVNNWTDVGWNTYYEREKPGGFSGFRTVLIPDSEVITIFVRVWKKWGVPFQELDVNLDAIALVGPSPNQVMPHTGTGGPVGEHAPVDQGQQPMPDQPAPNQNWDGPQQPAGGWSPDKGGPEICEGPQFVRNGHFEWGFYQTPYGEVGNEWVPFTNGGAANYGFYNEQWEAVVAFDDGGWGGGGNWGDGQNWGKGKGHDWNKDDKENHGQNGQLIEINSKRVFPTDPDRYAGIAQVISGLHPGATYELSLRGLLRGEGNEEDPYRFAAQWGYAEGPNTNWQSVNHWEEMDLGPIYPRTEPGPLGLYQTRFKAPAETITLFIRGWKKWAITNVEMDFNLDNISLLGCSGVGGPQQGWGGGEMPMPQPGGECYAIVKPGDTLGGIAKEYGVSVDELIRANGIEDPNLIYVGQKFLIPGCGGGGGGGMQPMPLPAGEPRENWSDQPMPDQSMRSPQGMPEQTRQGEPMREQPMPNQTWDGPQQEMPRDGVAGGPGQPQEGMMAGPMAQAGGGGQGQTYTVGRGDSLNGIAAEHGIDAYTLAAANGIEDMNIIYVGQQLLIP